MKTDLKVRTRKKYPVESRSVYYKIAKTLLPKVTLEIIGNQTNTDHATVIHGIRMFDVYVKDPEVYKMFLKCKNKCMYRLGIIASDEEKEEANVLEFQRQQLILIEKLEKTIDELKIKLNRKEKKHPPFIVDVLNLTPEQYSVFEERSKLILKAIKSYRTYENTPRSAFNAVN